MATRPLPWRAFLALGGALAVAALLAGRLPLLEVPGFELGLAAAILLGGAVGPALGIAAVRREGTEGARVTLAFAGAAGAALVLVALAFTAGALRAALFTPCAPLLGARLFALVALPSAILGAALGVLEGVLARGRVSRAAGLHAAVVCGSLAATLAVAYLGPGAAAYDHVLGVWPGPVYDEVLEPDRRLVLFRLGTLAWAAAAVALAALLSRRSARLPVRGAAAALGVALSVALLARAAGGREATRRELAEALGGRLDGPRCTIHFAREKGVADARRALLDCEYDAAAVVEALGLEHPPRATVWLHRSAEEKRRLVGAGRTSFTKPWLAEIQVQDEGVPHPILRHELVHALASVAARGPLRVPARAGVLVNAGLVEGLAVAVEVPSGPHGVHAWTRALRDGGRLPPLDALLGTASFFGAAPARAYTASGSFLRFLLDRRGRAVVLAAYRSGDVAAATGVALPALEAEWHRYLDGIAVTPALAAAAEARFERGSVFARSCAREVALLDRDAARYARGDPARAERLWNRSRALSGGDPAYLRSIAEAWRAAGDATRADALLREALAVAEAAGGRSSLRTSLLTALGDLRLGAGDAAGAAERYRSALALAVEGAEARSLRAKLAASESPALARSVGPWLLGSGDRAAALAKLEAAEGPLPRYLVARALLARGDEERALRTFGSLDAAGLPDAAFGREARRLAAQALCGLGRWEEGIAAFVALAASDTESGLREQAEDSARRCAFERDAGPWSSPVRR